MATPNENQALIAASDNENNSYGYPSFHWLLSRITGIETRAVYLRGPFQWMVLERRRFGIRILR